MVTTEYPTQRCLSTRRGLVIPANVGIDDAQRRACWPAHVGYDMYKVHVTMNKYIQGPLARRYKVHHFGGVFLHKVLPSTIKTRTSMQGGPACLSEHYQRKRRFVLGIIARAGSYWTFISSRSSLVWPVVLARASLSHPGRPP